MSSVKQPLGHLLGILSVQFTVPSTGGIALLVLLAISRLECGTVLEPLSELVFILGQGRCFVEFIECFLQAFFLAKFESGFEGNDVVISIIVEFRF
jgi:hypothetical protein